MSSSLVSDRLKHNHAQLEPEVLTRQGVVMSVNRPNVVIGQLCDEGGLSGAEEEEAASLGADPSGSTHTVNVLCCRRWRSELET